MQLFGTILALIFIVTLSVSETKKSSTPTNSMTGFSEYQARMNSLRASK